MNVTKRFGKDFEVIILEEGVRTDDLCVVFEDWGGDRIYLSFETLHEIAAWVDEQTGTVPAPTLREIAAWVDEQTGTVRGPSVEVATAPLVAELSAARGHGESLDREIERLRAELDAVREQAERLDKENWRLRDELDAADRQIEEYDDAAREMSLCD